jgi:hypothetical protein
MPINCCVLGTKMQMHAYEHVPVYYSKQFGSDFDFVKPSVQINLASY